MSEERDVRRNGFVIPAGGCGVPVEVVEATVGLTYGMNGVGGVRD